MATTYQDIIIDAEFAALIPPLSAEERQQLEENIVEHGGARDPLVVWRLPPEGISEDAQKVLDDGEELEQLSDDEILRAATEQAGEQGRAYPDCSIVGRTEHWALVETAGHRDGDDQKYGSYKDYDWFCSHTGKTCFDDGGAILLDGHNRYEICARLKLPFDVCELCFDAREGAADWMDRNQLGRRNLHPDAFTLLLGRRYNRAKRSQGGTGANQHSEQSGQNARSAKTAEKLANEHGVDEKTVRRAGKVAEAIDKLKAVDPAIESKMVRGKAPARAAVVKAAALLEKSPERAREIIEEGKQMAEVLREEKKAEKERIKQAAIERLSESEAESFGITHCSLTEWDAPQCQLVFTDPPYHDKHVDRFRELGQFAMRHLDEGRFLCTYTGKLRLADCVNAVLESGMEWVWIFSVYHPFSKEKHLGGVYNIAENWRPVLVFRKPGPVWTPTFQQDVVRGERSKSHHDWSQDEQTPEQLIQAYSVPGEIVLDPFCGGGTTPLAAKRVGRKCFACDVDIAAVAMATERLRGT